MGHAIGFWHEHTRPDRDEHVFINIYNVTKGKMYNFDKRTWGEIVTLDIPYDLGSDMHYGSKVSVFWRCIFVVLRMYTMLLRKAYI